MGHPQMTATPTDRPTTAPATIVLRHFERVNKELWLILSMFIIALVLNFVLDSQRMMLSFYTMPTLGSAYLYGRRHATLTALASVLMVALLTATTDLFSGARAGTAPTMSTWLDLAAWGGILIVTGYLMGTLYEHTTTQLNELRETYNGVLMLLRHFISKDEYTEHHSYRVSVYAARIAAHLSLPPSRVEDVRAAALLHDIGKLEDQPRAALQGRALHARGIRRDSAPRREGRGGSRNGRRIAAPRHPDRPRPS